MPSEQPKTLYLNLPLFSVHDTETTFNDYWHSINLDADGTYYASSAFQLIDTAYHNIDLRITNLPAQVKAEIADLFDQAMETEY